MDRYHIWCDLRAGTNASEWADAVRTFAAHLQNEGLVEDLIIERSKLGFRPDALGEWHVAFATKGMAQLDEAFHAVEPRSGEVERLHAMVWSRVENLSFGLYRDA